jgi:hypothetical protein
VGLDETLDDREPKTCAAPISSASLPEPIEEVREILRRDPEAGIGNEEDESVAFRGRPDHDFPSPRGKLDRVTDQVLEDLQQAIAIGEQVGEPARCLQREFQPSRSNRVSVLVENLLEEWCNRNLLA